MLSRILYTENLKMIQLRAIPLFIVVLFFISCEKNIDLDINQVEPVLVVDGKIESDQPPFIILTNSLSYFKTLGADVIGNAFVRNAEVFVSNGIQTHKLKEYSLQLIPGFTSYFYSNDPANPATAFTGRLNTSYSLTIRSAGKEYTSTTTIPGLNATLDSVWVKPAPQNPDSLNRILFLRITDPPGKGNYVRYFTKKNGGEFLPGENSVFDDQIIDGTTFDVQLAPGINRNNPPKSDSNFFRRGDTITLKFCDIDRNTFNFWNTWEFSYQSIGNPFAQPNVVIGNISNGALGAFSGYAPRFRTIVAQ